MSNLNQATRSLRFCNGDVAQAAEFVLRQRAERERRVAEAARRSAQQREARGWAPPHHCALHYVIKPVQLCGVLRVAQRLRLVGLSGKTNTSVRSDTAQRIADSNTGRSESGAGLTCRFGRTSRDRAVDMDAVEQLQAMGYERRLCAEALRQVLMLCNACSGIKLRRSCAVLGLKGSQCRAYGLNRKLRP